MITERVNEVLVHVQIPPLKHQNWCVYRYSFWHKASSTPKLCGWETMRAKLSLSIYAGLLDPSLFNNCVNRTKIACVRELEFNSAVSSKTWIILQFNCVLGGLGYICNDRGRPTIWWHLSPIWRSVSIIAPFDAFEISCIWKYYGKWSICSSFGANASFSIIFSQVFKT